MQLVGLFKSHNIKPIIGIIPDNQDKKLQRHSPQGDFWQTMQVLSREGWIIAQHGYQHLYVTRQSGLLGINNKSEFAGLPYEIQYQKIAAGKALLEKKLQQKIHWWMAPAHSFDETTCQALRDLHFTHVTDGLALYPFIKQGLTWVPQQLWQPRRMPLGQWTICLHPDTFVSSDLIVLTNFIKRNQAACQGPILTAHSSLLNPLFSVTWYFFYYLQPWLPKKKNT